MTSERIYLHKPWVSDNSRRGVEEVLESGWITGGGPAVSESESALADICDKKYALSVSSGTAALHLALLSLNITEGDRVILPSYTFAATANAVRYVGAVPIFVDISPESLCIDPLTIEKSLSRHRGYVKAVIGVDLFGFTCDHEAIKSICEIYSVPYILDAAESLGSRYLDKPSASFGDISCISFNGNKIVTASGGGALLTDYEEILKKAAHLATQAKVSTLPYRHSELGFNYRMPSLCAGYLNGQLQDLGKILERHREVREGYIEAIKSLDSPLTVLSPPEKTSPNHWLTLVEVPEDLRDRGENIPVRISRSLSDQLIEVRPSWTPLHTMSTYRMVYPGNHLNVTQERFKSVLCLPSGNDMDEMKIARVVSAIDEEIQKVRGSA